MSLSPEAVRQPFGERQEQCLRRAAKDLFGSRPDVVAVYLYGSAARGEPARDLDVAVLFDPAPPPSHELAWLAARLQQQGAPQGPEIDLRCLNHAAPRFRANVLRDGRLLADPRPSARVRAEARFMSQWLDFRPVWERMRKHMLERLAHG